MPDLTTSSGAFSKNLREVLIGDLRGLLASDLAVNALYDAISGSGYPVQCDAEGLAQLAVEALVVLLRREQTLVALCRRDAERYATATGRGRWPDAEAIAVYGETNSAALAALASVLQDGVPSQQEDRDV